MRAAAERLPVFCAEAFPRPVPRDAGQTLRQPKRLLAARREFVARQAMAVVGGTGSDDAHRFAHAWTCSGGVDDAPLAPRAGPLRPGWERRAANAVRGVPFSARPALW